jgi:hypothetical protein
VRHRALAQLGDQRRLALVLVGGHARDDALDQN